MLKKRPSYGNRVPIPYVKEGICETVGWCPRNHVASAGNSSALMHGWVIGRRRAGRMTVERHGGNVKIKNRIKKIGSITGATLCEKSWRLK